MTYVGKIIIEMVHYFPFVCTVVPSNVINLSFITDLLSLDFITSFMVLHVFLQ